MTYAILQNFPSGYHFSPGEGYSWSIQRLSQALGGVSQLHPDDRTIPAHNTYLTNDAIAFRQSINTGYTGGSENGVDVTMIIGHNLPSTTDWKR